MGAGGSLEKEKVFSHSRPSLPSFSSRTISVASQQERLTSRAITSERSASRSTKGDVTRDDSQRRFLVQHGVAMLEQCWNNVVTIRNNVGTMLRRFVELKSVRGYTVCFIQSKTHASATSFSKFFLKSYLMSFFKES